MNRNDVIRKTGKGVRIAVIDSGVMTTHPSLQKATIKQFAIVDGVCVEVEPNDMYGHGTACVGIIYKLSKDAEILVIQCLDEKGVTTDGLLVNALEWCIKNQIKIVNLSLGSLNGRYRLKFEEIGKLCNQKGMLLFASCHDTGYMSVPASCSSYLAVWGRSVKEKYTYHYMEGRFIAHGGRQIVCWNNGRHVYADGSSFATARMCGMAAKIVEAYPMATYEEYINLLIRYALPCEEILPPISRDLVVESNSNLFEMRNVAVYSFTKEIQTLLNFQELLNFRVKAIIDLPKKFSVKSEIGIPIYGTMNHENLNGVDTLLISRTSAYEELTQKDALRDAVERALDLGLNVYSLEYIDRNKYPDLYEKAKNKRLHIRHPIIGRDDYEKSQLYRGVYGHLGECVPVVGIFGTGRSQGKFTVQLMLRKLLRKRGYRACNFGTETHCELFGFEGYCPMEMNSSIRFPREQIIRYIQGEMRRIEIEYNPEIVVVGGQSGVVPYSYALRDDEYTVPTLSFLVATVPHIYVLCINVSDDREYIRDTIQVLECLGKGKVVALVASKIVKSVIKGTAFWETKIVDSMVYKAFSDEMFELFHLPTFDIMDEADSTEIVECILNYFSRRN